MSGLTLLLVAGLALFAWGEPRAAEPVTVTVQGVAGADPAQPTAARDEAVQAGILEAITEVTRGLLRAPLSEEESLRTSKFFEAWAGILAPSPGRVGGPR